MIQSTDSEAKHLTFDINNVREKVARHIRGGLDDFGTLESFLANWWCRYYRKPYKNPELLAYTLEELLIEYLDITFREDPSKLDEDQPTVEDDDEAWLAKQIAKTNDSVPKEDHFEPQEIVDERIVFGEENG